MARVEIAEETIQVKKKNDEHVSDSAVAEVQSMQQKFSELFNLANRYNKARDKLERFPIASAIVVFERPLHRDVCSNAYRRYSPSY